AGQDSVMLSYFYQRRGGGDSPESGDDLFCEYFDSSGQWVLLFQHLGSGPDMSVFEESSVLLPSAAQHSVFRIRFRSIGTNSTSDDDWYVDDIRVDGAPVANVSPIAVNEYLNSNDSTEKEIIIANDGQGSLNWEATIVYLNKRNELVDKLLTSGNLQPAAFEYPDEFFEYEDIKGFDDRREGFPVEKDAGGPDGFGYVWVDSDEPGGPVFSWVDISGSGTDIVADLNDDNYGGPYNIGFSFPFYGTTYNQIYIGSNGIIGFGIDSMFSRFKTAIPNTHTPDNMMAWLWDDLNPDDADNPNVHVYVGNSGGNYVAQFVNYPEYGALAGEVITAEVIFYPTGDIVIQYLTVAAGFDVGDCAIGLENADGSDGIQVAFLTNYIKNNLAVKFYTPYQWLGINQNSGSLLAGQSDTIVARIASGDLDNGNYEANIIIASNDPNGSRDPWIVPVQLTVSDLPPFVCGDVDNNGIFQGILELTYLVDYAFRGGPVPANLMAADLDGIAGFQGILELTYMVDYVFRSGPPPSCQ
ncbi:MAG: hypothetical protein ACREBV_05180, partial [Candidatus Zixiibacteriota bacterium]